MAYALFQYGIEPLDPDAVGDAFEVLPALTRSDAPRMVRQACGVLVDSLTEKDAKSLKKALDERGQRTEVVPDVWLSLPPPTIPRRAAATPETFVTYDLYGRPTRTAWRSVQVVATGVHATGSVVMTKSPEAIRTGRYRVIVVDAEYEFQERDRLIVEAITSTARYQITSDRFDYSYLGDRRERRAGANFAMLVGDILRYATGAVANRGTERLLEGGRRSVRYPNPRTFERESCWLRWRFHGPGREAAGPYRTAGR